MANRSLSAYNQARQNGNQVAAQKALEAFKSAQALSNKYMAMYKKETQQPVPANQPVSNNEPKMDNVNNRPEDVLKTDTEKNIADLQNNPENLETSDNINKT
jgi:hypothetical protein